MDNLIKTAGADWYKPRVSGMVYAVIAVFVLLGLRLFYLQVVEGDEYRRLSAINSIRLQKVNPTRGLIFDRAGRLLVDNRPAFELRIILKDAKPVEQTVARLSQYIGVPASELMETIARHKGLPSYKPILLKNDIGRDALAAVEVHRYDLPGVVVNVQPIRHYIENDRAAHLIGYLSEISAKELSRDRYAGYDVGEFIGKFGVEKTFETYLRGGRGGRQVEVNARGQVVRVLKTVPAQPGHNVYLTIPATLQKKAEMLLNGAPGAIVAMDPNNGDILALASSPSFDPNTFVEGMSHEQWQALVGNPFRPLENKAVHAEYPPASVYKIIAAMAGIEEGVIDENFSVFCPGNYKLGNRVFRCWKKWGHGQVDLAKALAESCDVYFYQTGQQLGVDRLAWYARACGLGETTGIDIQNESAGLVPTVAWKRRRFGQQWHGGETLSVAIGQGFNLVTPLQMVVMTAAVANGGMRYAPQIVKSVQTAEGDTVFQSAPRMTGRLPVSDTTLAKVRQGLHEVVHGRSGTARIARMDGVNISGKTGTAQVFSRKTGETQKGEDTPAHLKDHAWFVAYAPSEAPRIAVAVIVEHGEHGSSAAAPLARELIKAYLIETGAGRPDALPVTLNP